MQVFHAYGQFIPAEVIPAKEKTIINGKVYYIHTVQKGQTLYSISRAYGVSQEDILKENPGVAPETLKEGLALRIPVNETVQQEPLDRSKFYEHRVRRRQTVYSIARRYDVTEEMIYQYNPWARNGIQEDQILLIPKNAGVEAEELPQPPGVDQDTSVTAGSTAGDVCIAEEGAVYDVALLLPLMADYILNDFSYDSLSEEGSTIPAQGQNITISREFAEFYEGFLLAADSMQDTGMSFNLHVYDTRRDNSKLPEIQRNIMSEKPDLIIGPVYSEQMNVISPLANDLDVNIISPLSTSGSIISANPRLFQVTPSKDAECTALVSYLMGLRTGKYILIRDSASLNDSWRFKKHLLDKLAEDPGGEERFSEYVLDASLLDDINKILSTDEENYVVVFSESEPDVGELVSKLYMALGRHRIILFGQPVWQVWKTLELNFLHKLQLTIYSPFHVDYTNQKIMAFLKKCRETYGFEPYEISRSGYNFCMLGYDIGIYFLSALKDYGSNFRNCLEFYRPSTLLSDYIFESSGEGGLSNVYISFIRYNPDYTVEHIKMPY
jgi:LysM repeat protein/ABC-type branched-subunit amino acid transport system substrate-binding protein